jgi:2-amino-4-hydroxy-6-hydroxymethyldihydropteridine diphosphokinase
MILIALGANVPSPRFGPPAKTLAAALAALEETGVTVVACSRFYKSAPLPPSEQPWFVNCVASVDTAMGPEALLDALLAIERRFGRRRRERNAPRILDLDVLAYNNVTTGENKHLELPHPRMHERAFVLLPLADIAPEWRHPGNGEPLWALIEALPGDQMAWPCAAE